MGIEINYAAVASSVAKIKSTVGESHVISAYERAISGFSESKGEQAEALKELLKAEKELAVQLNKTLLKFANSIQSAADELKTVDNKGANVISQRYKKN